MDTKNKKSKHHCDNPEQKVRVLAIHGYRQNGEVFRQKSGSFRKIVHKYAQFTYVTAPHKVLNVVSVDDLTDMNIQAAEDAEQYGWWFNRDDLTFRGIRTGGPAIGFEETVKFIEDTFEEHGPFDGLLGFSQGAALVGLLCDMQQRGLLKCKFQFAIMAGGFKSGSLPHAKYYDEPIDLPTMHIYGVNDKIIPKEMSIALEECFGEAEANPIRVVHEGGHFLPANGNQKQIYQDFFKMCLIRKNNAEILKQA